MRIEELAEIAQMSPSAFHRQIKTLRSLSPLQYQKQQRLLVARRLMISTSVNARPRPCRSAMEARRSSAANTPACLARRPNVTRKKKADHVSATPRSGERGICRLGPPMRHCFR